MFAVLGFCTILGLFSHALQLVNIILFVLDFSTVSAS